MYELEGSRQASQGGSRKTQNPSRRMENLAGERGEGSIQGTGGQGGSQVQKLNYIPETLGCHLGSKMPGSHVS